MNIITLKINMKDKTIKQVNTTVTINALALPGVLTSITYLFVTNPRDYDIVANQTNGPDIIIKANSRGRIIPSSKGAYWVFEEDVL